MPIVQAMMFCVLLVVASIGDIKKREISPYLCVGIALLSLLNFKAENLLGLGIPFILWVCAVWICPNQLGGGDIKLTASASLVLGFIATAYGIIIAFTLELLKFQVFRHKQKLTEQEVKQFAMPLAPFLSIGFITTYLMNLGGLIL